VDKISGLLVDAADRFIMPRFKALAEHEIMTKTGPNDLVTHADLEAEDFLTQELQALYPDAIVLGEESVSKEEKTLMPLHDPDGVIFVMDPVDGTRNFVHGSKSFGVMMACVIDGVTRYSWIYDAPARMMYFAEKGKGAFRTPVDGGEAEALRVADVPVHEMTGHISYRFFPKAMQGHIEEAAGSLAKMDPIGSAAHEYTHIASGRSQVAVYSRLKPWDHLPGALLVQEAGGFVAKWDRSAFTPKDDYAGLIVTTSQKHWDDLYELFFSDVDLEPYL